MSFPYLENRTFYGTRNGDVHLTRERRQDAPWNDVPVYEPAVLGSPRSRRRGAGLVTNMNWSQRSLILRDFCADAFFDPRSAKTVGRELSRSSPNMAVFTLWKWAGRTNGGGGGEGRSYLAFMLVANHGADFSPELVYVCTRREARRTGIGHLFLGHFEDIVREHARITRNTNALVVFINALNIDATRQFYLRNGYQYVDMDERDTLPIAPDAAEQLRRGTFRGSASGFIFTVHMFKRLDPATLVTLPVGLPTAQLLHTATAASRRMWSQDVLARFLNP